MKMDQNHLATLATRITTSSAMNPSLIMCLIAVPLCFGLAGAMFLTDRIWPALLFIVLGGIPAAIACWQLVFFTIKDPDRLQREQHVEKKMLIQQQIGIRTQDGMKEIPIALSPMLTGNPQTEGAQGE